MSIRSARTRIVALLAIAGLVLATAIAIAPAARADTAPPSGTPATVSADALPTVQVNGVVWSQVTVGNTVYATGSFTTTWPAGQSMSSTNQTARTNLLAYNITTGALITSFNHSLNQQGLGITASPDGSTVYVVGDFTTVDGVARNHIAAFSTASGALLPFNPYIGGSTKAVTVSNSVVYVGGNFLNAGGATRTRLAAFTTSGALLSWAPTADVEVDAIVLSPDGSRVIVGGRFTNLNGVAASGLGAVDATSGATLNFAINNYIQDGGTSSKCGITSLAVDGNQVYGSGFAFGCGNFEGRFAADPNTGNVVWINDCHGDTYSVSPIGRVLYSVGHAHDCSAIGGFPDTNPRTWHRAIAETTYATGTDTGPDSYGWNYNGQPDATQLDWYPTLSAGTFTGQSQAAWSVTGNANYIALGGEFPAVNGVAQSGLVRFAVSSIAPNKVGPQVIGSNWKLSAVSLSSGSVRVSFPSNWDPDNTTLTYKVYRDSTTSTPVYTTTANSTFWQLPTLGFTDTGLVPGSTHQYKVFATDPFGNTTNSSWVSVTVGSAAGATSTYAKDVLGDGASDYWRFDEASGTTAYDYAGFDDMTENNGVTQGAPGSIAGDAGTASTFNGTNQFAATSDLIPGPNTFSLEGWFKTTSTTGGMIAGFGNSNTAVSSNYDRHIYMDGAGHVTMGVYNNAVYSVTTPNTYNDGRWHYVVGTLSGSGVALYVDGKLIGTNSGTTTGQPYSGYWRVGGDNVAGWPNSGNNYFNGSIDDVAVYPTALSPAKVRTHFLDAGGTIPGFVPAPTDNYGKTVYGDNPSLYYRFDETSGSTANDASGNGNTGTYYGSETQGVSSPISGSTGSAVTFSGTNGSTVAAGQNQPAPSTYSEELWFKTSTTNGGKLIGFGDSQNGLSGNYDRQVYMTNSGQLVFGVYPGSFQTVSTTNAYNDGKWHYMVATQGASGMNLYVDGQLIGSNPTTNAQSYNGYWRIGGDNLGSWPSQPSSNYFAGTIDEAAVYATVLSPAQVTAHYQASPFVQATAAPPVAAFTSNPTNLAVAFDGTGSSAPGGTIQSYSWDFGDKSAAGTGATPSHTYASPGTYTVTLTVTDSNGRTNSASHQVVVSAPANQPPVAAFTSNCTGASCSFDASGSSDPDGTITSYAWNFGDSATGTGSTTTHTYTSSGSDTVTLTVTDNSGATTSISHAVSVTVPPANQPPVAAFTSSCTAATCSFDASGSSDPDGTIASYVWTFGDGSNGTGVSTGHTYAATGTDTVSLTVTDNSGATSTVSHTVSPTVAVPSTYASDAFQRTVTAGWGTADTGGAWSTSGTASVSPGAGTLTMAAGKVASAYLGGVSTTDADTTATISPNAVGSKGLYADVIGRRVSSNTDYRARVFLNADGTVSIALLSFSGGTQATVKSSTVVKGLTYSAGTALNVELQVYGTSPTTVRAKVWAAGTTAPTAWQVSNTDTTASLQTAGSVGVSATLPSGSTNSSVSLLVSAFASRKTGN